MEPDLAQLPQALPQDLRRLADLATAKPTAFEITPDAGERAAIAEALGIPHVRKLRFVGEIAPLGQTDWVLRGDLGATVVQDCVITLGPVTTRIDEKVARSYCADIPEITAAEVEMPDDDTVEPLPATLDLAEVMIEALSLALPAFPKATGADLGQAVFAGEEITPMTDDDAKPFAGLQSLRDQLKNKGDGAD